MSTIRRALTGASGQPELVFRRRYPGTVAELREACTDPARLARWFGTVHGAPAAVGDAFTAELSENPTDVAEGAVRRCAPDLLEVSWSWQGEPESVITARFAPDGDGAVLTLHHALAQTEHAAGYGGGWEQALQALARVLGVAEPDAPADEDIEAEAARRWRLLVSSPAELVLDLPASPARVWGAFADAESLALWWWAHWDDVEITADVREGGSFRFHVPSQGIELHGTYLRVIERERLAFTWQWRDADGEVPDESADLRFEAIDGGTRLTVRHSGPWTDERPATNYLMGWEFTLDQLRQQLSDH